MSAPSPASAAVPYLTDSLVFDWKAQSFRADLIFVLPIAICLTLGIWLGHPGGAGIAAATFIGMILGRTNFILVLVTGGAGFVYGMLSLRQPGVSWVGQQSVVF